MKSKNPEGNMTKLNIDMPVRALYVMYSTCFFNTYVTYKRQDIHIFCIGTGTYFQEGHFIFLCIM